MKSFPNWTIRKLSQLKANPVAQHMLKPDQREKLNRLEFLTMNELVPLFESLQQLALAHKDNEERKEPELQRPPEQPEMTDPLEKYK
jgi:hypothetical protein